MLNRLENRIGKGTFMIGALSNFPGMLKQVISIHKPPAYELR